MCNDNQNFILFNVGIINAFTQSLVASRCEYDRNYRAKPQSICVEGGNNFEIVVDRGWIAGWSFLKFNSVHNFGRG